MSSDAGPSQSRRLRGEDMALLLVPQKAQNGGGKDAKWDRNVLLGVI